MLTTSLSVPLPRLQNFRTLPSSGFERSREMLKGFYVETLNASQVEATIALIQANLQNFDGADTVLIATFRRLGAFLSTYSATGAVCYVGMHPRRPNAPIACVGLGSLQGLSPEDGMGEIRDLVVDGDFRHHGVGSFLLELAIEAARQFGYKRLYLETIRHMVAAQQLFSRFGFTPILQNTAPVSAGQKNRVNSSEIPCYFVKENLET